ncbi:MAG TPA: bile acid:sodium symporter family protein [Polyangiaceae bacterium]|nr:bile acid:sodium symporter family protein [Polyangiaceae bacterium]
MRVLALLRTNWFVLGLGAALGLALFAPAPGARGGVLHSELTTRLGVVAIFALQGLTLPLEALRRGASNVRLHLLIQAVTFGLLPALGWALDATLGPWLEPELRLGLLYLCVLPSTIKTAVVFTSLAGGDAAAAIFSATLSSLLGVVLTPFLLGLLGTGAQAGANFASVLGEIAQLLLVPFFVGLALQRPLRGWAARLKPFTNPISSSIVLFIVYAAFSNSVVDGTWTRQSFCSTALGLGAALLVFLVATSLTALLARGLRLSRADTITAVFCAPQKTLASGAPLARLVFPNQDLGVLLLPLLVYHPLQLLLGSLLVSWLSRPRPATEVPTEDGSAASDRPR